MKYFSSKEDVFFSSANLHKKIHLSLALSKKLLIFLREEEGKAEAEGKGKGKGKARSERRSERGSEKREAKGEAKAMQPSCTEPNPRGTKGKKQGGGGGKKKEKEKGKGGKGGKRKEGRKKGKASPKIIGRGYSLASAMV